MATLFGRPVDLSATHLEHHLVRGAEGAEGEGSGSFTVPLCWHAEVARRLGDRAAGSDDGWRWAAARSPLPDLLTTGDYAEVTCRDCREWMSA